MSVSGAFFQGLNYSFVCTFYRTKEVLNIRVRLVLTVGKHLPGHGKSTISWNVGQRFHTSSLQHVGLLLFHFIRTGTFPCSIKVRLCAQEESASGVRGVHPFI